MSRFIEFLVVGFFCFMLGGFVGMLVVAQAVSDVSPDPTNGTGTLIIETGQTMKVNGKPAPIYKILHESEVVNDED